MIKNIPDDAIKEIQLFLSEFAEVYNDKGFDGVIQEMTGIDAALIEEIIDEGLITFFWSNQIRIALAFNMLIGALNKVSELTDKLALIYDVIEPILVAAVKVGHITEVEQENILTEFNQIDEYLNQLLKSIKNLPIDLTWSLINPKNLFNHKPLAGIDVVVVFVSLIQTFKNLKKSYKNFTEQMTDIFGQSIQAHFLEDAIEALGHVEDKKYTPSGDLFVPTLHHRVKIDINLSSAIRVYLKGGQIYNQKRRILKKIKDAYQDLYVANFHNRKRNVLNEIDYMERNPHLYQGLLRDLPRNPYRQYHLEKIRVKEKIYELDSRYLHYRPFHHSFEMMINDLEKEITKGEEYIAKVKQTIKQFYEKEQKIINEYMSIKV